MISISMNRYTNKCFVSWCKVIRRMFTVPVPVMHLIINDLPVICLWMVRYIYVS